MNQGVLTDEELYDPKTPLGVLNITVALYNQEIYTRGLASADEVTSITNSVFEKVVDVLKQKKHLKIVRT